MPIEATRYCSRSAYNSADLNVAVRVYRAEQDCKNRCSERNACQAEDLEGHGFEMTWGGQSRGKMRDVVSISLSQKQKHRSCRPTGVEAEDHQPSFLFNLRIRT